MLGQIVVKYRGVERWADTQWATRPGDDEAGMLEGWRAIGESVEENDAAELAHMAAVKWRGTCEWGTVVASLDELQAAISDSPKIEVTGMLLVTAPWFSERCIGVCLFHRTWMNNIFLDFLAAHPATQRSDSKVAGIGIGLVYRLAEIAQAVGANYLWGETTALSGNYYRKIFQQLEVSDRLVVTDVEMRQFCATIRQKWSQTPIT